MVGENVRATVLGFLATAAVFAALLFLAGEGRLLDILSGADLADVGYALLATLGWLAAWGVALRAVLDVLGVRVSFTRAFLLFAGAMFANNVTPFGQAGGEPVTALLITRVADTEYETGLAAIASVDTLNFVPSITIALFGAGYYATEVTLGTNRDVLLAIVAIVALAVVVPGVLYLGWRRRYALETRLVGALAPLVRSVAGALPRVTKPTRSALESRVDGFFRAIERVARNPRRLALALAFSAVGWFCQMVALWLSFRAVGTPIPLSVAMLVVPISAVAGVTPLPGGAGGIESVLLLLLVAAPLPAVTKSVALAAIVVFRGLVYWVPVVLGGAVVADASVRGAL
jgi:uncharacterized protein (TIRG00374 family)